MSPLVRIRSGLELAAAVCELESVIGLLSTVVFEEWAMPRASRTPSITRTNNVRVIWSARPDRGGTAGARFTRPYERLVASLTKCVLSREGDRWFRTIHRDCESLRLVRRRRWLSLEFRGREGRLRPLKNARGATDCLGKRLRW